MDLDELRVFVSIVERGSIAAASKSLRFPIATLRRRLDELESRMGVKLLERHRQGAVPTGAGRVLVDNARKLLSDAQALAERVRDAGGEPSGQVRMAIPLGLPVPLLASFFSAMTDLYPEVTWRFRCVDDPAAALAGDVQAAICLAERAPEGPWLARKLMGVHMRLLATPEYLTRKGVPKRPEQLRHHRLLVWEVPGLRGGDLPLADGSLLPITPTLRLNDMFLLRQAAARGLGIAFVPDGPLPAELDFGDGGLVRVLDGEVGHPMTIWLLAPASTWELPRMRVAFEHVMQVVSTFGGGARDRQEYA